MLTIILVCPADRLPTRYRQVANRSPTVGRLLADTLASNITHTVGGQLDNSRPTVGRQSADCCPTVGQQSANSWPTVGQQLTDSRPTGFLGSSSSQLPLFQRNYAGNTAKRRSNFRAKFRRKFAATKNEIRAFRSHYFFTILYFIETRQLGLEPESARNNKLQTRSPTNYLYVL